MEENNNIIKTKNFILIDDDANMSHLFEIFSKGYDIKWTLASNGEEGIELIKDNDYEFIFLDFRLPGLSGEETFRRIKQIKPKSKVIIISGLLSKEAVNAISELGYAIFIPKPRFFSYDFFEFVFSILGINKS